jgi:hypothetical protein
MVMVLSNIASFIPQMASKNQGWKDSGDDSRDADGNDFILKPDRTSGNLQGQSTMSKTSSRNI